MSTVTSLPIRFMHSRFMVPVLPFWWLSGHQICTVDETLIGVGFDQCPELAAKKSYSECLERSVYAQWQRSKINPFNGNSEAAPHGAVGFAAHSSPVRAQDHATNETLERICLLACAEGLLKLELAVPAKPSFGFRTLLRALKIKVSSYSALCPDRGHLGFTTMDLQNAVWPWTAPGLIFGSAFCGDSETAVEKATVECTRKLAFVPLWLKRQGPELTTELMNFWLSAQGRQQMQTFLLSAMNSSPQQPEFTVDLPAPLFQTFEDVTVSHQPAGRFLLPDPMALNIPLV